MQWGLTMATVVVTGTSTGIGFATAISLARAGHNVYATMRDLSRSDELRTSATQEGLEIQIRELDVDSDASVKAAIDGILAERGQIDALVNNAGIGIPGPVEELPLLAFRQCMETNYFGAIRCIQAVLPSMRAHQNGCIINVSSVSGRLALAPQAPYAASKFALEAMSECLAQEVKRYGIRVVIVEPGAIDTPMIDKVSDVTANTHYPHQRRLIALFRAAMEHPVSPFVVGNQIRDIIGSDSWQLRYPVGPDAEALFSWRASMCDETWVEHGALDDDAWAEMIQNTFGLDVRPYL